MVFLIDVAMTQVPLVSIGMPIYNCQDTVAQAIRSILAQTFVDWELLIVNDGSTDGTLDVVRQFRDPRIRVWSHETNLGLGPRLNETVQQSRGEYYARMDGDDVAYPQRLERQVAFLKTKRDVDLVGSWMIIFGKNGVPLGKLASTLDQTSRHVLRTIPIRHPTFLGRLEWFRKHEYALFPRHFQDQYLLLMTVRESRFDIVPEILLGYRQESLTIRKQLKYRWSYIQATPRLINALGVWFAFCLVGVQIAKMGLDTFAIGTGLNYRILGHRCGPATEDERRQWQSVWESVN